MRRVAVNNAKRTTKQQQSLRLIPKRRFAQNHFEYTRTGGTPEKVARYQKCENCIFKLKIHLLEMAHTNFVSSIRKQHISPCFQFQITNVQIFNFVSMFNNCSLWMLYAYLKGLYFPQVCGVTNSLTTISFPGPFLPFR